MQLSLSEILHHRHLTIERYEYALHYYQKAHNLRPFDERMSQSLAACYENLNRVRNTNNVHRIP